MKKKSKSQKKASTVVEEKPTRPNKYAQREDLEEAEHLEGTPLEHKKPKKALGIVGIKHRAVLKDLIKNVGKCGKSTMTKAMQDRGYSKSYSENGNIKKTKSWDQQVEDHLPDSLLLETHGELMRFKKLDYMLFTSEIKDEDIYELMQEVGCTPKKIVHGIQGTHVWFWLADGRLRKDATELAYKVKGKMAPDKLQVETTGLQAMSDAELAEVIAKQKRRFLKKD